MTSAPPAVGQGLAGVVGHHDALGRAQLPGVLGLVGRGREHHRLQAVRGGELHRHVPEPADAEHADALARLGVGVAQAAHRGEPGAEGHGGVGVVEAVGQQRAAGLPGQHQVAVAAAEVHPGLRVRAGRRMPALAVDATPFAALHPRDADPVAHPERGDAGAERDDLADRFVSRHDRQLDGPVAAVHQDVAEAHPARMNAYDDLGRARGRVGEVLELPRCVESGDHRCAHGLLLRADRSGGHDKERARVPGTPT